MDAREAERSSRPHSQAGRRPVPERRDVAPGGATHTIAHTNPKEDFMHRKTGAAIVAGLLALPATTQAHVSVHPNVVPAQANVTLTLRVPNESDTASTTRLDVQMPPGFLDVAVDAPGWQVHKVTEKLAKPIKTDEGTITTQIREIKLSGGRIAPGRFGQFAFLTQVPDRAGTILTFKTVQYYSDGKVSRWIGPPQSDAPAPTIDLTKAGGVIEDVAGGEAGPPAGLTGTPASTTSNTTGPASRTVVEKHTGASKGLGIAALVIALLALLAGLAALAAPRRKAANP
jgi:uncharacterized protein